MDIKKNLPIFIFVLILVGAVAYLFFGTNWLRVNDLGEQIPPPPGEKNENRSFEGKIYSTPAGAQFDDYFVASDGQEYGIDGINSAIRNKIAAQRDSGKTVLIQGSILSNVPDYGGRQIQVSQFDLKKDEAETGISNPASVYCKQQGGAIEFRETDYGTIGICVFSQGECEEWAFYRGECLPGKGNITLENCDDFSDADFCTEEYSPVCARVIDKDSAPFWQTFSNACHACISGETIYGYKEGECN